MLPLAVPPCEGVMTRCSVTSSGAAPGFGEGLVLARVNPTYVACCNTIFMAMIVQRPRSGEVLDVSAQRLIVQDYSCRSAACPSAE